MKALISAAALSLVAMPAFAADWTVNMDESHLRFEVPQTGGAPLPVEFESFTADITFDPDNLDAASATVEVDLASAKSADKQKNAMMAMPVWLDSKGGATATYAASSFRQTGEGEYVAEGELTLKGVTHPVNLPFTLSIDGDTATAKGETMITRADFNLGGEQYADDKYVGLEVKVMVDLVATK